jgi:uncharacterized protein (TIGR02301 family)
MARRSSGFGTNAFIGAALALALICAALPARAASMDRPMENGLERLAEILGSVHHLREVCGANEGALWRNKMIDMMNVAALDAEHRQRMISHFNEGYYQAQTAFPGCSGRAAARANALFDEAHRLAARLAGTDRSAAAGF